MWGIWGEGGGAKRKHRFFLVVHFLSAQINNSILKCSLLLVWNFFGYAKKSRDFFGWTNSAELWDFFGHKI